MKKDKKNLDHLFPKLDDWFRDMDEAFNKIKESHQKGKINNLLNDNDIDSI